MGVALTGAMDPDLVVIDLAGAPAIGGPPANLLVGETAERLGWMDVARLNDVFPAPEHLQQQFRGKN